MSHPNFNTFVKRRSRSSSGWEGPGSYRHSGGDGGHPSGFGPVASVAMCVGACCLMMGVIVGLSMLYVNGTLPLVFNVNFDHTGKATGKMAHGQVNIVSTTTTTTVHNPLLGGRGHASAYDDGLTARAAAARTTGTASRAGAVGTRARTSGSAVNDGLGTITSNTMQSGVSQAELAAAVKAKQATETATSAAVVDTEDQVVLSELEAKAAELLGNYRAVKVTPGTPGKYCTNTCKLARNWICNEARVSNGDGSPKIGNETTVMCDLGTDCEDCGPWEGTYSPTWTPEMTPLEFLHSQGIQVKARMTATNPPFVFPYTPDDKPTTAQMRKYGVLEGGMTQVMRKIMKNGRCLNPKENKRRLFLDIGANSGYYSIYAAMFGCRVVAWEPIPKYRAFLEWAVASNNVSHLVAIRPTAVGDEAHKVVDLVIPTSNVWGAASVDGMNNYGNDIEAEKIQAITERLEDVVKDDIHAIKIDVQGYEQQVMRGAGNLLNWYKVENVILEYTPGIAEATKNLGLMLGNPLMLTNLARNGYQLQWIPDAFAKNPLAVHREDLPTMEEVTLENLAYDLNDLKFYGNGTMGCPKPLELKEFSSWNGCNSFPEDVNPRSFRSMFLHSTNVWGTRLKSLQLVRGVVGVEPLPSETSLHSITPPVTWHVGGIKGKQGYGLGMVDCEKVPVAIQVRMRCPCRDPSVCGDESRLVQQLTEQGMMAMNYNLAPPRQAMKPMTGRTAETMRRR